MLPDPASDGAHAYLPGSAIGRLKPIGKPFCPATRIALSADNN